MTDHNKLPSPFLLFLGVSLLVYGALFPLLSWTVFSDDDSHLMRVATDYAWWQHFFVPSVYLELSAANYTPIPLAIYSLLVSVFGFSTNAFLIFMLLCISTVSALAGLLTERLTQNRLAAWAAMLLILSSLSLTTLITRFYTMHYVFGGIFALAALVFMFRPAQGRAAPWLPTLFMFLALLSKEVYLVLPVMVAVYALYHRNLQLAAGAIGALLVYLMLRTYMLGMSVDIGAESSYFAGVLGISGAAWLSFIAWYLKTRVFILATLVLALVLNPRRTLMLLPIALAFAAPGLAVSHGIIEHTMHGDRIFFAFDCALAIVAILALAQSQYFTRFARVPVLAAVLVVVLVAQTMVHSSYRSQIEQQTDFRITDFILQNREALNGVTLFVPMNFIQGDLMRVNNALGHPPFYITQNCMTALGAPEDQFFAFDGNGNQISREQVQASCLPADTEVQVDIAPRYDNGVLQWQLQVAEGYSGGILFVDRAFAVPIPQFSQQLVKPSPGERYQVFATNGTNWWFSDIEPMEIVLD